MLHTFADHDLESFWAGMLRREHFVNCVNALGRQVCAPRLGQFLTRQDPLEELRRIGATGLSGGDLEAASRSIPNRFVMDFAKVDGARRVAL